MLVNVAKGKKIRNAQDFAKVFHDLSLDHKTAVVKKLNETVQSGISSKGKPLNDTEKAALKQLNGWCTMNLMVGELCPPENLSQY